MLAVQHAPRMGSTQQDADAFMPFGYAVDPTQDGLFDAPDPAGAPLLSENDTKFLSSFFDDMTSDQYNMPSFGEGLNFSDAWLDLPPQFMGHSTSFGQQANQPQAQPLTANPQAFLNDAMDFSNTMPGSHLMPPPPAPPALLQPMPPQPTYQGHPDDVINAAATLLQNNSNPRSASRSKDLNSPRRPIGPPIGHLRHQGLEEFKEESRKDSADGEYDHTFTQWMFAKDKQSPSARPSHPQVPDLQWGSDAAFAGAQPSYVPAPNKESVESQHKQQMQVLDCFELSQSASNTRQSSPVRAIAKVDDADAPPRKRRKSKNQRDGAVEEDDDDEDSDDKLGRKKKGKGAAGMPSPPDSNGKRRKSGVQAKAPRENLSEEQKRENHIKSEQKRRTVIKEGFDDLCELVPGLKGGGFSKSTMLTLAAEWLEELLKGNEVLAAQLGRK